VLVFLLVGLGLGRRLVLAFQLWHSLRLDFCSALGSRWIVKASVKQDIDMEEAVEDGRIIDSMIVVDPMTGNAPLSNSLSCGAKR